MIKLASSVMIIHARSVSRIKRLSRVFSVTLVLIYHKDARILARLIRLLASNVIANLIENVKLVRKQKKVCSVLRVLKESKPAQILSC